MGWYKAHSTLNKPQENPNVDRCLFCGDIKEIKRTDFVLEYSEFEQETGKICKDCYVANAVKVWVD